MSIWGALGSAVGGLFGGSSAKKQSKKEFNRQKTFAKKTIQWKVRDANEAGIHPLYALGAQTHSYQPQSIMESPLARGLSEAGQSLAQIPAARKSPTKLTQTEAAAIAEAHSRIGLNQAHAGHYDALATETNLRNMHRAQPSRDTVANANAGPAKLSKDQLRAFGIDIDTNPNWSDAEKYEERYGDIISSLIGAAIIGADAKHNVQKSFPRKRAKRPRPPSYSHSAIAP